MDLANRGSVLPWPILIGDSRNYRNVRPFAETPDYMLCGISMYNRIASGRTGSRFLEIFGRKGGKLYGGVLILGLGKAGDGAGQLYLHRIRCV